MVLTDLCSLLHHSLPTRGAEEKEREKETEILTLHPPFFKEYQTQEAGTITLLWSKQGQDFTHSALEIRWKWKGSYIQHFQSNFKRFMNPPKIQAPWVKNLGPSFELFCTTWESMPGTSRFSSSLFSLLNSQLNYITETPCTFVEMCDWFLPMDMSSSDGLGAVKSRHTFSILSPPWSTMNDSKDILKPPGEEDWTFTWKQFGSLNDNMVKKGLLPQPIYMGLWCELERTLYNGMLLKPGGHLLQWLA